MALSFTARNSAYGLTIRVSLTAEQNATTNTSVLRISGLEICSDSLTGTYFWTGTISIAGAVAATLTASNVSWCAAALQPGRFVPIGNVSGSSGTIFHQADGTKTIPVSINISGSNTTTRKRLCSIVGSAELTLPPIPRASGIRAAAVTLGREMTITLDRAVDTFTDTLSFRCGSASGVIAQATGATTLGWVPPIELAEQCPQSDTVPVILEVTTHSGSLEVGSREIQLLCPIPETVVPVIDSITLSDNRGFREKYGSFVQNQSQANVHVAASGAYGSAVESIRVSCGGLTAAGVDTAFSLPNAGTVPITITVTDSRGRTANAETSLFAAAYTPPRIDATGLLRCDENGTPAPDGSWAKILFRAEVTPLGGFNSARYTLRRRLRGTEIQADSPLDDYLGSFTPTDGSALFPANIDSSYEVLLLVRDDFAQGESILLTLSVAFALIDVNAEGKAIGIGQRANRERTLSVGLDMKLFGHRITDLAPPQADSDAATRGYVDEKLRQLAALLGITD